MNFFNVLYDLTSKGREEKRIISDGLRHGSPICASKMSERRWRNEGKTKKTK